MSIGKENPYWEGDINLHTVERAKDNTYWEADNTYGRSKIATCVAKPFTAVKHSSKKKKNKHLPSTMDKS